VTDRVDRRSGVLRRQSSTPLPLAIGSRHVTMQRDGSSDRIWATNLNTAAHEASTWFTIERSPVPQSGR
jgi:hypothetical protein